jgi:3-isopropylmalate/(R)-2-methylmalate dehydratase small subunit
MQPLDVHRGKIVPLLRRDIDTDQIIPKQFLKSIERQGFGQHLFHNWRIRDDGTPDPAFVLNDARYAGASILVAGDNFGCGSSREHAAWALLDYGFRAVIAPSFADIFRNNAVTNGLLPLALPERVVTALAEQAQRMDGYTVEIDLSARHVRDGAAIAEPFDIEDGARHRLLHGLDDIALILQHQDAIDRYEQAHAMTRRPSIPRRS